MAVVSNAVETEKSEKQSWKTQMNEKYRKFLEELQDSTAGMTDEECARYEQRIIAKLKSGKQLSAKEMNFLRIHNPLMYRTAMRVKLMKQSLKEQLKHCKSKEEAKNIIFNAISGISAKDPDKEYLIAGLRETANNFKKSNTYARLPDTREEEKKTGERKQKVTEFDDGEKEITPIQELLDVLPTFDVVQ